MREDKLQDLQENSPKSRAVRILYMEDDAGLARLFQRRLELAGYDVDVALHGEEGLSKYDPSIHDIIVVDYQMPVYNGLDVLRILGQKGSLPATIMLTGTDDEQTTVEAMKLGVDETIVKDMSRRYLDMLPAIIEQVLQGRHLRPAVPAERVSHERDSQEREQRMLSETLRAGAIVLSSTLNYDEVLDRMLDQVSRIISHDASSILLIDSDSAHISRWKGYAQFGIEKGIASTQFDIAQVPTFQQALQTGLAVAVPRVMADDAWVKQSGQNWIKSYATIPISHASPVESIEGRDTIIGFLNVDSAVDGYLGQVEAERLQAFVSQAAIALENARLYNHARQEVTERMRALKRERNFIAAILDTAGALVIMLNARGRIIRFNRTCEQTSGYSFDEVRGKFLWDKLLPPEEIEDVKASYDRLLGGEPANEFESHLVTKTGEKRILSWSNAILSSPGFDDYIISIGVDITERRQMEEALHERDRRYELVVNSTEDGVWEWRFAENQIYYSKQWLTNVGYNKEPGRNGPPVEWFSRIHPEDFEVFKADLVRYLKGSKTPFYSEHRLLHQDESYHWVISRGSVDEDKEGNIYRMVGSLSDINKQKVAEQKLMYSAWHDALTGLPNRTLFMNHLERSIDLAKEYKDYLFAVLFIDLDRFKVINDSLGHLAGDKLLIEISQRLKAQVRSTDTVARFGGDEFAILLDDIAHADEAKKIAARIQEAAAQAIDLAEGEVFTSASIGIALSSTGYEWPQDILRDADTTLYRAKALGRSRYEVFEIGMRTQAEAVLQLEAELRQAIDRHEFQVYYQPITDLKTGQITGVEALLRWQHPERGLINPDEFIPLAEETGLILVIGSWVLQAACVQLHNWHQAGYTTLRMTVNVSPQQFQKLSPATLADEETQSLQELVEQILNQTSVPADRIELEITENLVRLYDEFDLGSLHHLRALGVRIAIDDFGVGSSLSFLKHFPIDTLKIDQSFVKEIVEDAGDAAFVRAIIAMAHSLSLKVIAEGVITEAQKTFLRKLKCDEIQGYLFSQPLPAQEITKLLQKQKL